MSPVSKKTRTKTPPVATAPHKAMVMAAGLGLRMRPLTLERPKPLIPVMGKPMLDHALDRLEEAGVTAAVVNSHYKGEMIAAHLAGRTSPAITLSPEDTLLETGGGVKKALPLLGTDRSMWSTPTSCGSTAHPPPWRGWPATGTRTRWTRSSC